MATAYGKLLDMYQPRPIHSEKEYGLAIAAVEKLMDGAKGKPTKAESDLIDLIAMAIQNYESHQYPRTKTTPGEMLEFLIKERGTTQAKLAQEAGVPQSTIANVIAGRRSLSTRNVIKLAKFFSLQPEAFMPVGE